MNVGGGRHLRVAGVSRSAGDVASESLRCLSKGLESDIVRGCRRDRGDRRRALALASTALASLVSGSRAGACLAFHLRLSVVVMFVVMVMKVISRALWLELAIRHRRKSHRAFELVLERGTAGRVPREVARCTARCALRSNERVAKRRSARVGNGRETVALHRGDGDRPSVARHRGTSQKVREVLDPVAKGTGRNALGIVLWIVKDTEDVVG